MPITSSEIKFYLSETNAPNADADGGFMNKAIPIADNVLGGVIGDILGSERESGAERHYKLHVNVEDGDNLTYKSAKTFMGFPLDNDVVASVLAGTDSSTWLDVSADHKHGCGHLATTLTAGSQTVVVDSRGVTYDHFQNGDLIVITDRETPDDATGNLEYATIDQAPIYVGNQVTLHVSTASKYGYALSRSGPTVTLKTRVSSVQDWGDVKTSITLGTKASTAGTTDNAVVGFIAPNVGAIAQVLTFTFDSATTFAVSSNRAGVTMPAGNISSLYDDTYIKIPAAFWTGTWANGDTLQISTTPASLPLHVHLNIPVNAALANVEAVDLWVMGATGSS